MSKSNDESSSSRAMDIFQSGDRADFVIEVVQDGQQEKKEFNVHSYVLMLNSDVFREMFKHKSTKEFRESRITLKDFTATAVHQMLIYMYTGALPKEYDMGMDAIPLTCIADKYNITPLVQLIEQGLVNSLSLENVIERLELAHLCQIKSLHSSCDLLIRRNRKTVQMDAKWVELKKKSPILADLVMGKKLGNPIANHWKTKNNFSISTNGLNATYHSNEFGWRSVSAEKGFIYSADSAGPVLFYFEVTNMSTPYFRKIRVGFSHGNTPDRYFVGELDSYAVQDGADYCWLSGKKQNFEWPNGAIKPKWNGQGDVIGCGLVLHPEKELSIFFTGNGILMGKQIQVNSSMKYLYPTVSLYEGASAEANFGNNLAAKPFKYDIDECLGLDFE